MTERTCGNCGHSGPCMCGQYWVSCHCKLPIWLSELAKDNDNKNFASKRVRDKDSDATNCECWKEDV